MNDTGMNDTVRLRRLRRTVLGLIALGLIGLAVDLTLLAHDEDFKQYVPFIVIGLSVGALAWHLVRPGGASRQAVQAAMIVTIITGPVGVVLHYRANMEFQLDIDPSLGGVALAEKVLTAKAPPALAPVNMSLLGLIGFVAVRRESVTHPVTSGG